MDSTFADSNLVSTILDPKNDIVFKLLLTRYPAVLRAMVRAVLPSKAQIKSIEILNPEIPGEAELEARPRRSIRLDVRVRLDDGTQIDVEMQSQGHGGLPERVLLYWSRLFGSELRAGDEYSGVAPVIALVWLNAKLYPEPGFHTRLVLHDPELRRHFTDRLCIHIVEIPKVQSAFDPTHCVHAESPALAQWARFLTAQNPNELEALIQEHPAMQDAKEALEQLSADPTARRLAQARELDEFCAVHALRESERIAKERGLAEGRAEGRAEGLAEGRAEGRAESLSSTLLRLLLKRFGHVPPWATERVKQAAPEHLEGWIEGVLEAQSLEAVFDSSN